MTFKCPVCGNTYDECPTRHCGKCFGCCQCFKSHSDFDAEERLAAIDGAVNSGEPLADVANRFNLTVARLQDMIDHVS